MDSYIVVGLIVNAGLSVLVGYVASQKGRSSTSFFLLSFFLSFLVGILVVLALPSVSEIGPDKTSPDGKLATFSGDTRVKCPYCAEWVKVEAKVCKHCGKDIAVEVSTILQTENLRKAQAAQDLVDARNRNNRELEKDKAAKAKRAAARRAKITSLLRKPTTAFPLIGFGLILLGAGIYLTANFFGNIAAASVPPATPTNLSVSELGFKWEDASQSSSPMFEDAKITGYHFTLLSGETVIFEEDLSVGENPDTTLDSQLSSAYRASGFPISLSFQVSAINKFGTSKIAALEFEAPKPALAAQDMSIWVTIVSAGVVSLPEGLDALLSPANETINMWSQPLETTCVYTGVLEGVVSLVNTQNFADACSFPDWNFSPSYKGAGTVTVEATTTFNGGRSVTYSNSTDVAGIKMY